MEKNEREHIKKSFFSTRRILLLAIFFYTSTTGFTQTWELIRSFPSPEIHKLQPDQYGNLFVADKNGNIFKLDSLGKTLETYSPAGVALPSDLQVSQSVNVFVFYEDWQRFVLLDRFLGNARTYEFSDSDEIGYVKSACWASDGNVWLFDQSNFSLKKYNPTSKIILLSFPFNFDSEIEELEITQLREYEGKIIGVSENQIFVFSFTGNLEWTHKIEEEISEMTFSKQSVFWMEENKLVGWNFFENDFNYIPLPKRIGKLHSTRTCWIGYQENRLNFYKK